MLFSSLAFALTPEPVTSWATDATGVRLLEGPLGVRVVTFGAAIEVRDGAGILEARSELAATAVEIADLYADGTIELLVCGDDGLVALSWTESGLGSPITIETTPCTALAATTGGFLVGGDSSRSWTEDGVRTDLPLSVGLGGIILPIGSVVWATTPGTNTITTWDGIGATTIELGGTVGGLTEWGGQAAWSLTDLDAVGTPSGSTAMLDGPTRLAADDFDLSGAADLVILHPERGSLGVLLAESTTEEELAGLGTSLALDIGTLEGDCPSVVVVDGINATVVENTGCAPGTDADGDDWTAADGDCDDQDATIFPGAEEPCDGVDQDCDGVVDDLGVIAVSASDDDADEGGTTTFGVAHDGCDAPTVSYVLSGTRDGDCVAANNELACTWTDDGDLSIVADAVTTLGSAQASFDLTVDNLDPEVNEDDWGTGIWAVAVGESASRGIRTIDVDADEVTCFLLAGPPGLQIDGNCEIDWMVAEADQGVWNVQLLLADEDGGRALVDQKLEVSPGGCGSGCGDGCASGAGTPLGVGLFATLLLRRRRN